MIGLGRCICYMSSRAGVEFGINFMSCSCSENGKEIARGAAECNFAVLATTSGIYPKNFTPTCAITN